MNKMTNFATFDEQLKGVSNLFEDENQACPCSEAGKENVSVTFANLFEFNRINSKMVIKESPGSACYECDRIFCESNFDVDELASTTSCKMSKKRAVSFAPSCQVIHVDNDDNEAFYLCHEAVKEGSSQGCPDDEIGHILGSKKKRGVSHTQGTFDSDVVPSEMTKMQRSVSFAPSCPTIHLIDDQTQGTIEDELWYSQDDFMDFEDEALLCSQMIRDGESQGIFQVELGHILGLEKFILCDKYFDQRDTLIQTVLNEQAVQQLVKDLGVVDYHFLQGSALDKDSNAEDFSLVRLAKTSDRLSRWARERASTTAFTLEHDLANDLRSSIGVLA